MCRHIDVLNIYYINAIINVINAIYIQHNYSCKGDMLCIYVI